MSSSDDLARRLLDALQGVVTGTEWAAPDGSVVKEALVVMVHVDADGTEICTWVNTGSLDTAAGMARKVVVQVDEMNRTTVRTALEEP